MLPPLSLLADAVVTEGVVVTLTETTTVVSSDLSGASTASDQGISPTTSTTDAFSSTSPTPSSSSLSSSSSYPSSSTIIPYTQFTSSTSIPTLWFQVPQASVTTEAAPTSGISTNAEGSFSKAGIISLSVSLVILFGISLAILWRYHCQRRAHARAMLITPRLLNNTREVIPEISSQTRFENREPDGIDWIGSPRKTRNYEEALSPDLHTRPHAKTCTEDEGSSSSDWELRSLEAFVERPRNRGIWDPTAKEQNVSENHVFGNRSNFETPLPDAYQPKIPTGWHDAFDGLSSLRQNLSPSPLKIVKHSASNPNHQSRSPVARPRPPLHIDTASYRKFGQPLDTGKIKTESNRDLNISRSEGDIGAVHGPYTPSVYSQDSDAEPVQGHKRHESRTRGAGRHGAVW